MENKNIPGKIILFGEHIVLVGGRALAIPLQILSGKWAFAKNEVMTPYKKELIAFGEFLQKLNPDLSFNIDVATFISDINNGLFFESNIPVGYGAGSSGAIVAAICKKYSDLKISANLDLPSLKKELGLMENHFHGASSGTDPLISLLNKPLLIDGDGHISTKQVSALNESATLFLLDTGVSRKTGPLVEIFRNKMKEHIYETAIRNEFIPTSNLAIDQLLQNDITGLTESFQKISQLQYQLFREMIPDFLEKKWIKGLMSDLYCLKLCGAGGGGFLLGMTNDLEQTRFVFRGRDLMEVF